MLGLSAVAENSRSLPDDGCGSGLYLQINYDMTSGEVWSDLFAGRGHNSWEEYHDPNVLRVCFADNPMTEQEIADKIELAVEEYEYQKACS